MVEKNITAIALSQDGLMRIFQDIDLSTMKKDPNWTTYMNLHAIADKVVGLDRNAAVDFCCPKVIFSGHTSFDPLGRPTVPAGSDHYFCTCFNLYVGPHFSKYRKTNVA